MNSHKIRIAKLLSNYNQGSRREIERLISNNKIYLNQKLVTTPVTFASIKDEILIEGKVVPIDIREVGDGYFDVCWQRDVLKSRVFGVDGFYVPSETHAFWTKVYHALIHRKKVPLKYQSMLSPLDEKKDGLYRFMMDFGYKMEEPSDVTLFFNSENGGSIKFTKERRWRQSKKLISKIKLRLFYLLSRLFRLKTRG